MRFSLNSFRMIMKIGLPAGIQSAVFAVSNIVIQSAINSLGTVVIAASSAAFNIEVIAYDVMNSFSQACTTFVGQNYGAGQIKRCKRTLWLTLIEDTIASGVAIGIVLLVGRFLLSVFNNDPQVIEIGYTRLVIVFSAYTFSMLYEIMSGYLRGFGVSLVGCADNDRRLRNKNSLDRACVPEKSQLRNDNDGLSHKPRRNGAVDIHSAPYLSSVTQICK